MIELRSAAPLLPMRIFRLRTLTGSNVAGLLMGAAIFSQFFLLTLYMQQVLHYSAIQTGVAYIALTLTIIVFANVAQVVALRIGLRVPLGPGCCSPPAGWCSTRDCRWTATTSGTSSRPSCSAASGWRSPSSR